MIRAIIFDMDGVIVDSIPMHMKIWGKIFEKRGINFSTKVFEKYNGTSTIEIGKSIIKEYNLNDTPENIFNEKHFYEEKYKQKEIKMFKEAVPTLKILRKKGYKIALATGSKKYMVDFLIKKYEFNKYFDAIALNDEVKHSKPAPDIFLLASKKLKIQPKNCIVVEDALNGIIAAKKAKMESVAITTTFKKKVFLKKTKFIIKSLDEVIDVLEELKCAE